MQPLCVMLHTLGSITKQDSSKTNFTFRMSINVQKYIIWNHRVPKTTFCLFFPSFVLASTPGHSQCFSVASVQHWKARRGPGDKANLVAYEHIWPESLPSRLCFAFTACVFEQYGNKFYHYSTCVDSSITHKSLFDSTKHVILLFLDLFLLHVYLSIAWCTTTPRTIWLVVITSVSRLELLDRRHCTPLLMRYKDQRGTVTRYIATLVVIQDHI